MKPNPTPLTKEQQEQVKKSLKGQLDQDQYENADILFYDELARGRVLGRLYKLVSKIQAQAIKQERSRVIEIKDFFRKQLLLTYRTGEKDGKTGIHWSDVQLNKDIDEMLKALENKER